MSEFKYLKFEKANGVARITFARPKHNVMNIDMMNELNCLLEGLGSDGELKCLVLLGEGKSWCAGVEVGDHKPETAPGMIAVFDRLLELIHLLDVPSIAAVHGACLGGGMEVAIACDIVVASSKATFGQPEIRLGFFRHMLWCGFRNWSGPQRQLKSALPAGFTPPGKPSTWGLSAIL